MTIPDSQKTLDHLLPELTSAGPQSTQRYWTVLEHFLFLIFVNILHGVLKDQLSACNKLLMAYRKPLPKQEEHAKKSPQLGSIHLGQQQQMEFLAAVVQQTLFTLIGPVLIFVVASRENTRCSCSLFKRRQCSRGVGPHNHLRKSTEQDIGICHHRDRPWWWDYP